MGRVHAFTVERSFYLVKLGSEYTCGWQGVASVVG
ncbi:hypothetical protein BVI1335_120046 [Burkholderia vietnamiensis]|nr:hypothetical protein BVI1335_120046 [Burkholderia vietnamiensis]